MSEYYIKTRSYELFPNKQMKAILDRNCDYRRFCWNETLTLWNDRYDIRQLMLDKKIKAALRKPKNKRNLTAKQEKMLASYPAPNWRSIRNKLVAEKEDWTAIKTSEIPLDYTAGVMSFYRLKGKYYVAIPYTIPKDQFENKKKTYKVTGIDINIGHFNYKDGQILIIPKSLSKIYSKIKHYQKQLTKKRVVTGQTKGTESRKYLKTRNKLQASYQRAQNIQKDVMHKFTTKLVNDYDSIVIEDLNVKGIHM